MQLVTPNGEVAPMAPTEAKKDHDPKELEAHRRNLALLYNECVKGFMQDMQGNPEAPQLVKADFDKVRAHYAAKWRDQVGILNRSGFAHMADPEKVHDALTQAWADFTKQMDHNRALPTLQDITAYEFKLVGQVQSGTLYLNDVCALSVHEGGLCRVWVRAVGEKLEDWCSGWLPTPKRAHIVESVDYTLNELHNLLQSCRIVRMAVVSEELMDAARKRKGIL